MMIFCCSCGKDVSARLSNGEEAYPHRRDLYSLPFWFCDICHNFVGCHHKTKNRTKPLGCIPNATIKLLRKKIHSLIDPLWESGKMSRREVYSTLSKAIGREYHTAEIRSASEGDIVLSCAKSMKGIVDGEH
jgi:hypothetical protein